MVVGLCEFSLIFRGVHGLKEKRGRVRKVVDRVASRFRIAIAETANLDSHREARVGFALVGNDSRQVESTIDHVLSFIDQLYLGELTRVEREVTVWRESLSPMGDLDDWGEEP
jgi:hypothetical protein